MILITGGCGFIGLHTARALLDLGESCVLTRHRAGPEPELIGDEVGKRIFIEALDIADAAAFAAIGERHDISGIVHLAAPGLGTLGLFDDFRVNLQGLLNTLEAADRWEVPRITIASSIGVYLGIANRRCARSSRSR